MKMYTDMWLTAGIALLAVGISTTDVTLREGTAAAVAPDSTGKVLFAQLCATCHGVKGDADSPMAKMLDPKPTDFTSAEWQTSRTDEEIERVISGGKGTMPPLGSQLSGDKMKAVIAFIRGLGREQ
ncbi:MAG: c-type cytochrome [Gemmatimonadales bacterium]